MWEVFDGVWVFYIRSGVRINDYRLCILGQWNTQQTNFKRWREKNQELYLCLLTRNTVGIDPAFLHYLLAKSLHSIIKPIQLHEINKCSTSKWCLDLTFNSLGPRRYCSVFTTEISFPESCTATSLGLWEGATCCGTFAYRTLKKKRSRWMRMMMTIIIRASFIIHYHVFIIYLVVLLCCYYVIIMMISVMKHAEDDSRVSIWITIFCYRSRTILDGWFKRDIKDTLSRGEQLGGKVDVRHGEQGELHPKVLKCSAL